MYCEQIHLAYDTENEEDALDSIMEFWTKITPGILQLLSQNKVVCVLLTLMLLTICVPLIIIKKSFFCDFPFYQHLKIFIINA